MDFPELDQDPEGLSLS